MKNLFDRENSEKIRLLNEASGLNHRSKPFDINNKEDLNEMLKIKVCALLDYTEYEGILYELLERFDESIEYHDAATWLSFTMDTNEPDKLLTKCYDTTRKSSDNFRKLTNRTSKECLEVLSIVLNSSEEIQKYILGFYISNITNFTEQLNNVFDNIYDVNNDHNMEQSYNNFIEYIKKNLTKE